MVFVTVALFVAGWVWASHYDPLTHPQAIHPQATHISATGYYLMVRVVSDPSSGMAGGDLHSVYTLWSGSDTPKVGDLVTVRLVDGRFVTTRRIGPIDEPRIWMMGGKVADVFEGRPHKN